MMQLRGSSVMITGGCGGIGLATGRAFAERGLAVTLVDREIERGAALAAEFDAVELVACDLGSAGEIEERLGPYAAQERAPDILINNVGISPKYGPDGNRLKAWTTTLDQWNQVMAVNVTSHFLCARLVLPAMIERRAGRIVNVASYAARTTGYQAVTHYVASKSAVLGLTKALAKEASPFGVNVNAINPGRIVTEMTRDVPEEVNRAVIPQIPAGRLGQPEDIAKVALFLASDLSDYVTGTAIEVNGGLYLGP